jgi:hypothetical protein
MLNLIDCPTNTDVFRTPPARCRKQIIQVQKLNQVLYLGNNKLGI